MEFPRRRKREQQVFRSPVRRAIPDPRLFGHLLGALPAPNATFLGRNRPGALAAYAASDVSLENPSRQS